MKIFLLVLLSLAAYITQAQIAHFSIWRPYPGQEKMFEQGYKQHLQWHKYNGDTWSWYGWYIVSGKRAGYFVDATFDHAWSDFDKPVNPAGDAADNEINTEPYGEFLQSYKVEYLPACSYDFSDSIGLKSKFLRMVTIDVQDIPGAKKVIEFLRESYRGKSNTRTFLTYKMVDGDYLNRLVLILGYSSFAEYGKSAKLEEDLTSVEDHLGIRTISSMSSETLVYKADMSLFPN
jgi:hypothetical protein